MRLATGLHPKLLGELWRSHRPPGRYGGRERRGRKWLGIGRGMKGREGEGREGREVIGRNGNGKGGKRKRGEGEEGSGREERVEKGQGGLDLDICPEAPEFLVTPLLAFSPYHHKSSFQATLLYSRVSFD